MVQKEGKGLRRKCHYSRNATMSPILMTYLNDIVATCFDTVVECPLKNPFNTAK